MDLLLLRHGIAEEPSEFRGDDSERPLTQEGIEKLGRAVKAMRLLLDEELCILSSPYARTKHTAEIVASGFPKATLTTCSELALGGSMKRVLEEVSTLGQAPQVMLVGHEPELVELANLLTGVRAEAVQMKRGALMCLRMIRFIPQPRAILRWHLAPGQLEMLSSKLP
jgi:phosphohistidine phosphatase